VSVVAAVAAFAGATELLLDVGNVVVLALEAGNVVVLPPEVGNLALLPQVAVFLVLPLFVASPAHQMVAAVALGVENDTFLVVLAWGVSVLVVPAFVVVDAAVEEKV